MNDVAAPCAAWIQGTVAELAPRSHPIGERGFERLPAYFPEPWLTQTRVVTVQRIPFPPLSRFGLPEFASLEQMAVSGITFDRLCLVHEEQATEGVHFHELVHAVQWVALGPTAFMLTYGVGLIEYGYAQSPLEVAAFDFQSQFDRGQRIVRLVETITARARQAHAEAAALYDRHGLELGV